MNEQVSKDAKNAPPGASSGPQNPAQPEGGSSMPREEQIKGYIVVDKDGDHFDMNDLATARTTAADWNEGDPDAAPHRVFEVIWREVQS